MNQEEFNQKLAACKGLMLSHQFADALVMAKKLFELDQDNMALHLLLATLYAKTDDLLKAMSHYMLLCQFDPGFEAPHCTELARGYHQKGYTDLAAVLAQGGAVKLDDKDLYILAADYYQQSDNAEQAQKMRERAGKL